MSRLGAFILVGIAAAIVTAARSGHELPIYPSFYPHEIEIRTLAPEQAADALRRGKTQVQIGAAASLAGAPPESIRAIESLGAFVVVRVNPQSRLAADDACAAVKGVARQAGAAAGVVFHPYPVTPFHGDYLYHADLAADAGRRLSDAAGDAAVRDLKVRAGGSLRHPGWIAAGDADWDIEVTEVDAAGLMASATFAMNGWLAPPWLRTGWFHAERLLADAASDPGQQQRVQTDLRRLRAGDFADLAGRINFERDVVSALAGNCRRIVAGYTVKREYVNVEFSAGIENIGFDAIAGLASPIFIRTVKLKDFPWNGELALGIGERPAAAWNPIGGMTDPFGRLMGSAVADPALLPSPYDAQWMLNRVADLPFQAGP